MQVNIRTLFNAGRFVLIDMVGAGDALWYLHRLPSLDESD